MVKIVYIVHNLILLRLNPFDLSVDREGCHLDSKDDVVGSLTMGLTGKFVYIEEDHARLQNQRIKE